MLAHMEDCETCQLVDQSLLPVAKKNFEEGLVGYSFDEDTGQYSFDPSVEGAEVASILPAILEFTKLTPSYMKKIFLSMKEDCVLTKGRGYVKGIMLFAARFDTHFAAMTDDMNGRDGRAEWHGARQLEANLARLKNVQPSKFLRMAGFDAKAVVDTVVLFDKKNEELSAEVKTLGARYSEIHGGCKLLKQQVDEFETKYETLELTVADKIGRGEALDKIEENRKLLVSNITSYARVASIGQKVMRRDMDALKKHVEPFMVEISNFKKRMDELEKRMDNYETDVNEIKKDLRRHSEENKKTENEIKKDLRRHSEENKKHGEALDTLDTKLAQFKSTELPELWAAIRAIETSLKSKTLKEEEVAEQQTELNGKIKQLRKLIEEVSGRGTTLSHDVNKMKTGHDKDLAELESELKRAVAAYAGLETKLVSLKTEALAESQRAAEAEAHLQTQMDAETERATEAEAELKKQVDQLKLQLETDKSKVLQHFEELKVKSGALREDLDKMKLSHDAKLEKAARKGEELDGDIAEIKVQLEQTRAERGATEERFDKMANLVKKARSVAEFASGKSTANQKMWEKNLKLNEEILEAHGMTIEACQEKAEELAAQIAKLGDAKRQNAIHVVEVKKTLQDDAAELGLKLDVNAAEMNTTKAKVDEIDQKLKDLTARVDELFKRITGDVCSLTKKVIGLEMAIEVSKEYGIDLATAMADVNSDINESFRILTKTLTSILTNLEYVQRGVDLGDERSAIMWGDFKQELDSMQPIIETIKSEMAEKAEEEEKARADEAEKEVQELKENDDREQAAYEEATEEFARDVHSQATTEEEDEDEEDGDGKTNEPTGSAPPSPKKLPTAAPRFSPNEPDEPDEPKVVNELDSLGFLIEQAYAQLAKNCKNVGQ